MRRSQFSDDEILALVEEAQRGIPVEQICEAAHVSVRTFYRWRRRLSGVTPAGLQHLNSLEAENRKLKRQLAFAGGRPDARLFARPNASMRIASRAECGMDRNQTFGLEAASDVARPEMASRLAANGAGARTGRFAHLRSGGSRR